MARQGGRPLAPARKEKARATSEKPDARSADAAADLAREIAGIRADLAALTKTLGQLGKERAESARNEAADLTQEMTDEALKLFRGFRKRLAEVEAEAEDSVRSHPTTWMGGLLGILGLGILLGLLVRRKD